MGMVKTSGHLTETEPGNKFVFHFVTEIKNQEPVRKPLLIMKHPDGNLFRRATCHETL